MGIASVATKNLETSFTQNYLPYSLWALPSPGIRPCRPGGVTIWTFSWLHFCFSGHELLSASWHPKHLSFGDYGKDVAIEMNNAALALPI